MPARTKTRPKATRSRSRRPRTPASAKRVAAAYKKVKFGSRRTVARSLKGMRLATLDVGALLDNAKKESLTKANQLAIGIVGQKKRVGEERTAIRGMMRWAAVQTSDADARRRIVLKAFL